MARLLRVRFPGAIHHVSTRGIERRLIFRDDADRAQFLAQLAESKELYSVRLFLVCLMPNHFHLLLETPGGGLARDDAEFAALYLRARLSVGSDEFTEEVRHAHQEVVRKAARPEDAALRRGGRWSTVEETLGAVSSVF